MKVTEDHLTDDELIAQLEQLYTELDQLDKPGLQDRYGAIAGALAKIRGRMRGVHEPGPRQPRSLRRCYAELHSKFTKLATRSEMIGTLPPEEELLEGEQPGQWMRVQPLADPEKAAEPPDIDGAINKILGDQEDP